MLSIWRWIQFSLSFMELLVYYYSRERRTPILQSIWKVIRYLCKFCLIDVYVLHSFLPLSFHLLSTGLTVEILLLSCLYSGENLESLFIFPWLSLNTGLKENNIYSVWYLAWEGGKNSTTEQQCSPFGIWISFTKMYF